jgi:uncharacterized protein YPO0396
MEIYNWGTFDKKIFKIKPESNNSLLTGANGSGKTTFIDALLTLLVPSKKDRFYNQSSGIEKKGDRNEESYVLGHYGDIQNAGEQSSTTQRLRDRGCYSVLLASFANSDERIVTLFQVRSFSNGVLKRTFGIAHKALEIQTDFSDFDAKGNWKRKLDKIYNVNSLKKRIEYFDGPTKYAERMVQLFGMRSTKALSLFNQVVGIKVLGDLDEFIRTNMLEWRDAENEYIQLRESFLTLMDAKNNIDKAKEQISQLAPINDIAIKLTEINETLTQLQTAKEIAVYWFAEKGVELSENELKKIKIQLENIEKEIANLKNKKEEHDREKTKLTVQIETDEVGRQIQDLITDINRKVKSRDSRKIKLDDYNKLAQRISFSNNPDSDSFFKSRELAKKKKIYCTSENEVETEKLRLAKNEKDAIEGDINNGIESVRLLKSNENNISGRVAQIREDILQQVGATRDEIPFVGELIKIDDNEKEWEASIEKVLYNFALRLIVPEKYYQQVNEYVNSTNLKGKIIYQRYKGFTSLKSMQSIKYSNNALIHKISFKSKNPYVEWIEDRIINQFNYNCVENLKEFDTYEKAITKEGLIKFGKGTHEKDDRKHIISRENYVLGWDNKEKISWWKTEIRKYQEGEKIINEKIRKIEKSIKLCNELKDNYSRFFNVYTKYDEIDWQTYANEIQIKEERKTKLEKTNDKVKELQKQLTEIRITINENETVTDLKKDIRRDLTALQSNASSLLTKHSETISSLSNNFPNLSNFENENNDLFSINYSNFEEIQRSFQINNRNEIKELEEERNELKNEGTAKVSAFKNPPEEIAVKYKSWRSDVNHLPTNIEYISDYQKKYVDLKEENLPRFETKFNNYLEETIINKVADFKFFFDKWSDDIKSNIEALNESLYEIDFKSSPKTYIQLVPQKKLADDVKEFVNLLHYAIPNYEELSKSIDGKRIHFENNIEPLITQLENESWRTNVMEVRSWFEYKAEEFYRENNQKFKTYSGMGHLSGGEKAQLTFTILGSAIAYQFGLTKEGLQSNSFRFIAIDEAFKAQDEDKARYLITLCKQLHLQLLVVTPSDNIHIVEDDISFVHFVERRNEKSSWLYDMPIEQFKEERDKFIN